MRRKEGDKVRSFFLQLFLSFWIVTIGIFIGSMLFFPNQDPGSPDDLHNSLIASAQEIAELQLEAFHERGCPSPQASAYRESILVNAQGQPLCGARLDAASQGLVRQAVSSGKLASRKIQLRWVQVQPVTLTSGGRWFVVRNTPTQRRPWWPPLPRSAVPVSIVVTFLFAYFLTRPVRALSGAFRRFTGGDLSARLPVATRSRWRTLGGADIQPLALDFNSMADRVVELIEAQKLLVRDLSHELRSPLARLRVAIELARDEAGIALAAFDRMEWEAERVNDLIGEMLTLSLMESTQTLPRPHNFTINEVLDELLPDITFEADARGCTLRFEVEDQREFWLLGEKEMVHRALENILRNSIRYTPAGQTIEVEVLRSIDPDSNGAAAESVIVCIKDRGPGVPEQNLPNIFRPFYRVDMAREGSTGGFGVGLAIAERAVHLHGGSITATNRTDGGLEVNISLPSTSVHPIRSGGESLRTNAQA